MPYCRQRNARINFNQSCEEDGRGEMELIREIGKYLTSKKVAKNAILIVHITRKSDCAVYLENIQNLLEKSESSI